MSETAAAWVVIVAGGVGTFLTRASFLFIAHRFTELPPRVRETLRMIPPAVLAALTVPAILRPGGGAIDVVDARLVGGLLALAIAWRTKNLLLTTAAGLAVVTVLEQLG